jgi:hypothetical protein
VPRLMSVAFTEQQVRDRAKTVTRRKGWWEDKNGRRMLKPGDRLTLCRKVMGRKPDEPLVRICDVEVVSIRREPLAALLPAPGTPAYIVSDYAHAEMAREGFPRLAPVEFVRRYFIVAQGMTEADVVTRIEWRYLCGAVGFWGVRNTRFVCELRDGHESKNHECGDVIWFGDHTPPCSCGRCPAVVAQVGAM